MFCVQYFCVELHCIQFLLFVLHGCNWAIISMRDNLKALRGFRYIVHVGHPHDFFLIKALVERGCGVGNHRCFTELPLVSRLNLTTQGLGHELHTVAHAQDRDTQFENFLIDSWCPFFVYGVWTACENNPLWLQFFDFLKGFVVRVYFTVYMVFADATGDQLVILATKVDDDNEFFCFHSRISSTESEYRFLGLL